METIGLDAVREAPVRRLAGGAVVALLPGPGTVTVAHRVVCSDLVPLALDPDLQGHPEFGLVVAEAGPGATGRCRAVLTEWDEEAETWACARGHHSYRYDEAECLNMWAEEERERRAYQQGAFV